MMKYGLKCLGLVCVMATSIWAQGLDDTFRINESAIVVQKLMMSVVAENIANAATYEVEGTGEPYRKKYVVTSEAPNGVRATAVGESQEPFPMIYEPSSPYADENGNLQMPNINLPSEMVVLSLREVMFQSNLNAMKTTKSLYQVVIEALK